MSLLTLVLALSAGGMLMASVFMWRNRSASNRPSSPPPQLPQRINVWMGPRNLPPGGRRAIGK